MYYDKFEYKNQTTKDKRETELWHQVRILYHGEKFGTNYNTFDLSELKMEQWNTRHPSFTYDDADIDKMHSDIENGLIEPKKYKHGTPRKDAAKKKQQELDEEITRKIKEARLERESKKTRRYGIPDSHSPGVEIVDMFGGDNE